MNDKVINEDEKISINVCSEKETVWLIIDNMSKLFEKSLSTINVHILNIYSENELKETETVRKIGISDFSTKHTNYYNLDVIISVGYRVKSLGDNQFRQWATKSLKEYIRKGFIMDDERLKYLGGGGYWKELLQRIRDIRSYETMNGEKLLSHSGTISCEKAINKSTSEYKKYQQKTLNEVNKAYLESL